MTPIEEKEIKGVNAKNVWWLIASTAVIVATVITTVNSVNTGINDLKTDIKLMQKDRENDRKYYDLKMDELQKQVNTMEGKQSNLNDRVEELESDKLFNNKK
jgi:flagellar capping protein FliD